MIITAKECGEIPSGKVKALRVAALGAFLLVAVSYSVLGGFFTDKSFNLEKLQKSS